MNERSLDDHSTRWDTRWFTPLCSFLESRYLIKNTATAITSITHALNIPPRATGRTLDTWSDLFGSAIDINKHLDHIGFNKINEILVCKISYLSTVPLIRNKFSNSGQVDIQHTYIAAFNRTRACLIDTEWITGVLAVFSIWIIASWNKIKVLLREEKQRTFANNFEITVQ